MPLNEYTKDLEINQISTLNSPQTVDMPLNE